MFGEHSVVKEQLNFNFLKETWILKSILKFLKTAEEK